MNLQQLDIIMEAAIEGSISKAASKLFLAQSNASSSIKALEEELGYLIFQRTKSGLSLTKKGERFIEYAQVIKTQILLMKELKDTDYSRQFRLGYNRYSPAVEAFYRLNSEYALCSNAELSCLSLTLREGVRALIDRKLDLMAIILIAEEPQRTIQYIHRQNLTLNLVKTIPICVNLRRVHPLVNGEELDFTKLGEYPIIDYQSVNLIEFAAARVKSGLLSYKYKIVVNERDTRCRVVSTSNAFSVGAKLPASILKRYGLVNYVLPIEGWKMYYAVRKGEETREEIRRYLELLEEELEEI